MITLLTISCFIISTSISPINLALATSILSIAASLITYSTYSTIFAPSATVISFSSGIIILFCYCSIITNFESNNNSMIITPVTAALLSVTLTKSPIAYSTIYSNQENLSTSLNSPLIIICISIVVLAIIAINITIFTPNNPLNASY